MGNHAGRSANYFWTPCLRLCVKTPDAHCILFSQLPRVSFNKLGCPKTSPRATRQAVDSADSEPRNKSRPQTGVCGQTRADRLPLAEVYPRGPATGRSALGSGKFHDPAPVQVLAIESNRLDPKVPLSVPSAAALRLYFHFLPQEDFGRSSMIFATPWPHLKSRIRFFATIPSSGNRCWVRHYSGSS